MGEISYMKGNVDVMSVYGTSVHGLGAKYFKTSPNCCDSKDDFLH